MNFVIITGMSGAGKTEAVKCFEDMGYYCIDNMPPALFSKVAKICSKSESDINKIAFVIDTRGGSMLTNLEAYLDEFEKENGKCTILFLDTESDILIKRYKETRRKHPLSSDGNLTDCIEKERALLDGVKKRASYVLDTSCLKPRQLKEYIYELFSGENGIKHSFTVSIVSFGFKYGVPLDSDTVFDVRFLPNPFYIPELKPKTGLDSEVADYVNSFDITGEFMGKLNDMMEFLLPNYISEGKSNLVISIGCTGGKHRSVTVANNLGAFLKDLGYKVIVSHRDINK